MAAILKEVRCTMVSFSKNLLDLLNLFKAYEHAMPGMSDLCPKLLLKISAMIDWLRAMIHPDEGIGFFNDSALEHEPEPGQIFSYASKLGFSVSESIEEESKSLEQTGYVRLAKEHAVALIDAAQGPDYVRACPRIPCLLSCRSEDEGFW